MLASFLVQGHFPTHYFGESKACLVDKRIFSLSCGIVDRWQDRVVDHDIYEWPEEEYITYNSRKACFNCGLTNHRTNECHFQYPVTCRTCGELGHRSRWHKDQNVPRSRYWHNDEDLYKHIIKSKERVNHDTKYDKQGKYWWCKCSFNSQSFSLLSIPCYHLFRSIIKWSMV